MMSDQLKKWMAVAALYRQDHRPLCEIDNPGPVQDDRRCDICVQYDKLFKEAND